MSAILEATIKHELDQVTDTSDFMSFYKNHVQLFQNYVDANYTTIANRLKCGTAIVQNQYDLLNYMVVYGGFLYQCLDVMINELLQNHQLNLEKSFPLHIVDYACGQGSATLVLIDHLIAQGYPITSLNVTLIEPSPFSLNRAKQLIEAKAKQHGLTVTIECYNCEFDQLTDDFIQAKENQIFFHLFANILDLYCFNYYDLSALVAKIKSLQGQHYAFAMSTKHPLKFRSHDQLGFDKFNQFICPREIYIKDTYSVSNVQYYRLCNGRGMATKTQNVMTYACRW